MDDDVWRRYFDAREDVALPNGDVFRTYRAGASGPNIVLLHGGGYTSMTWCLVTALLKNYFTIHTIDLRGHGATRTANDDDLSIATLVQDVVDVLAAVLPPVDDQADASERPQTVLAGHSLGGAVAVRVAATERVPSLVGVMVIDVVEGTALASLEHMHQILARRPKSFSSVDEAVNWALHSGTVRNSDAAAVSIPSQLSKQENGKLGWRTDLKKSAPYWRDWFIGLSEQFLSLTPAKILVLAGSDRLDTALMRGQMMGKFELRLLYGSGHCIQEDCPDQLAKALVEFCSRCARTVSCELVGLADVPGGAKAVSSNADLLAQRLARARAMLPAGAPRPPQPPA
ncbi:hypothetical protein P43SY_003636 [Pythium insidiosum]|uniref:Protein phosphatase methylesterase 1 n=1 Tax=Pythium insidiosum TaxID=114742 RepID=A0AAD5LQB5_PYTIN|nr:hypothetical protein P43SY_003636 [Pythium insidiosum]KAJ0409529.1 hypothetical protein ATCC90586_009069 [Pythium insidiosum]